MHLVEFTTGHQPKVTSDEKLTSDDFRAIARALGTQPRLARKSGLISVRIAQAEVRVETLWNGRETSNTARPGDAIATSLDAHGAPMRDSQGNPNVYVIEAQKFVELYEPIEGSSKQPNFRARGTLQAIKLGGGFDIIAPWGERQHANSGYLLFNGTDVYGNQTETFEATYQWL